MIPSAPHVPPCSAKKTNLPSYAVSRTWSRTALVDPGPHKKSGPDPTRPDRSFAAGLSLRAPRRRKEEASKKKRGRMPELPEVEAARRAIEEHCLGKRITRCSAADDPKVIDGVPPSDLESSLVGKTILAALRKGKNLWLRLDSPPFPTFQFGQ